MARKANYSSDPLLKEIRERYKYAQDQWKDIRNEAEIDMRFISGDPWSEKDKRKRADAGRPCLSADELGQYVNQAINNLRQNKRGIKINPAGDNATDKTAQLHEDIIRGIEYRSAAQRNAYIPAYENALQRSYGYFRISRNYESDKSFNQDIIIKGILNPDSITFDPDCKTADWSDAEYVFVLDPMSHEAFKRRFKGAKITSFDSEHMDAAADWIRQDHVIVGEYWKAVTKPKKLLLVRGKDKSLTPVFEDEMQRGMGEVIRERMADVRTIVQRFTNGIEILDEKDSEPGPYIPIIPVIGKEMFVNEGGKAKRKIMSMVRLARDPQQLYNYLLTQEAEEAKLTPKVPVIGYKGQFESDSEAWENLTDVARAYVQVDLMLEGANGQVLPLPQWKQYTPNFQAYEIAKDSARRAIQAAMGITPLPTAAQRNNEKSGVALDRISEQESIGAFHFIDNFDRALEFAGKVIEKWLPVVYDTSRTVGVRKPDDSHQVIRINTPHQDEAGQEQHFPVEESAHDVTVSTGPSYQSQREEIADFLDSLLKILPQLGFPPPTIAQIMSLAVQMRNMGPKGDQIAEILAPPQGQNIPPQAIAAVQQAQQQLQAMHAYAQQVEGQLRQLQFEKQAKIVDNEARASIEKMKIEAQLAVAEVQTRAQQLNERLTFVEDLAKQFHAQAHDRALSAQEHEQDKSLADKQAAAASAQMAQQASYDQQNPAQRV